MKRIGLSIAVGACALLSVPAGLEAQRIAFDLRTVGATSTERFAGADMSLGVGLGATLAYFVQPHLAAYGGWDWVHFRADQSFAGTDMDFEETGYTAGLRFEHPIAGTSPILFRIEAGGTYKHVEVENAGGDIIADSGHELGFETGGGAVVPLATSWRLVPTVRYRSLSPDFTLTGVTTRGNLRYVGVELALSYRF